MTSGRNPNASSRHFYGCDSTRLITASVISAGERRLGAAPKFWGRYFKGPGNQDTVQYQSSVESAICREKNLRVVPVARQTPLVGGGHAAGRADGLRNGAAVLAAFGAKCLSSMPSGVLVFLDVEPEQSMSAEYYRGWAEGLVAAGGPEMSTHAGLEVPPVTFLPAVYMKPSADPSTLQALLRARELGAPCAGVWISRQYRVGCDRLRDWDHDFVVPRSLPSTIPVWLWQWIVDCAHLDFNMANPDIQGELIERLVLPRRQPQLIRSIVSGPAKGR